MVDDKTEIATKPKKTSWYQRHKNDPGFVERRRQIQNAKNRANPRKRSAEQRERDTNAMIQASRLRRERLDAIKISPCADCSKSYPAYVMDFDHRPGTKKRGSTKGSISYLVTRISFDRLLEEIAKCDLVCANCHRVRTYARLHDQPVAASKAAEHSRKRRAFIASLKQAPCVDCQIAHPHYVLDFDHREGTEKDRPIARMGHLSHARLLAEVAKCDVVCANCHRERTHRRKQ